MLVVTNERKLILHHRDNIPGISHPGCWAGFGGAVERGESLDEAVRREMKEETGVDVEHPIFLSEECDEEGDGSLVALYYVVGDVNPAAIDLREGDGIGVFDIAELHSLKLAPFVRRAIHSKLIPKLIAREL